MRGFALAEMALRSFDRQFGARCRVQRPDRYRLLDALRPDVRRIARGGGVSYVGASFGAGVISQDLGAFDRLLAFDGERGLLEVEAGATIGAVQRFALSHGWYLPVTPGHPRATIGGCIAADVHGKNPARDGTFRRQVEAFELHSPSCGKLVASANAHADLFAASFAGFGLTGLIVCARLRLARPPASLILRRVPVRDLAEAADVLREAANARLLYGWHDGRAAAFGRGVIQIGLAGDASQGRSRRARASRDLPGQLRPWPLCAWHRSTIAAANTWLGARWRRPGQAPIDLAEALFPLNRARGYFAAFGPGGMDEAQWLIPHARFDAFAEALREEVARRRPRITLMASKLFAGPATDLAFDGHGIALAIQLAAPREAAQAGFLEALAELAIGHGGRPNLVKDSSLTAATVRRAMPAFEAARARLATHNPGGLYGSELSRRLAL